MALNYLQFPERLTIPYAVLVDLVSTVFPDTISDPVADCF